MTEWNHGRSHRDGEIIWAVANGHRIIELDTMADGLDDTLILDSDDDLDVLQNDVMAFHGLNEMPDHWSLEDVTDHTRLAIIAQYGRMIEGIMVVRYCHDAECYVSECDEDEDAGGLIAETIRTLQDAHEHATRLYPDYHVTTEHRMS